MCALERLFHQDVCDGVFVKVYLTDDGCTDGTADAVRVSYPQVTIIQGDGTLFLNRGMWNAWNMASSDYDYDYYLWLNDDTYLFPCALRSLTDVSSQKNDRAIIVGATVDVATECVVTYGGWKNDCLLGLSENVQALDYFNGNVVLIPKFVYNILGNLDYNLCHALGDFDYGWRARQAGIEMYQAPGKLAKCDSHSKIDKWCDPSVPFTSRWKAMFKPNGMPPGQIFYITRKHKGLVAAIQSTVKVYIRCILPMLWKSRIV